MSYNTASIADAMARERASDIAQQSPAGNTDDTPTRVYVSWAGQNVRFWSTTPPADMPVTTYVAQAELDAALDMLENAIDLGHSMESEGQAIDAARAFLTKHGRLT